MQGAAPERPVPLGELFVTMPVTRRHWIAGFILFGAFVIESWEMMVIIFAGVSISAEFKLSSVQLGSLIGSIFLGMIPGALLWGWAIDKVGRKRAVVFSLALYGIVSMASAAAVTFEMLWLLRFTCGIALAGLLVTTFPYFEELLPVRVRGSASVYLASGWPLGLLIAVAAAYMLAPYSWRYAVALSAMAGLWAIPASLLLPESPHWLHAKGRDAEALKVVAGLSTGPHRAMVERAHLVREAEGEASFFGIFRRDALLVTTLQTIVNLTFSLGYWALSTWMPALLAKRGLSAPEGLGFIALSALFMFPGYVAASLLTGQFGRKKVMVAFVSLACASGFGFASAASVQEMYAWNFLLSFSSLGAWGIWNTWMGEIYTTRVRMAGYAWGIAAQRIANAAAPVAMGVLLERVGVTDTVMIISSALAITIIAAALLPETEGGALE